MFANFVLHSLKIMKNCPCYTFFMNRETIALLLGIVGVAVIAMSANSTISSNQLAAAVSKAQLIKVERRERVPIKPPSPIETTPLATSPSTATATGADTSNNPSLAPSLVSSDQITETFGVNKKDANPRNIFILQRFLAASGFLDPKYITGEFGARTKQAVIDFQKANGIKPVSGFIGDLTKQKINEQITIESSR